MLRNLRNHLEPELLSIAEPSVPSLVTGILEGKSSSYLIKSVLGLQGRQYSQGKYIYDIAFDTITELGGQ